MLVGSSSALYELLAAIGLFFICRCDDRKVVLRCLFCFCAVGKLYFSFLETVLGKTEISSFCVCLADTGLFFIVAVTTKSTLSFCFYCIVRF